MFSVEVAIGACGGLHLAAKTLQVQLPMYFYFALFFFVSSVYGFDHLYDIKKVAGAKDPDERRSPETIWRNALVVYTVCSFVCTLLISYKVLVFLDLRTMFFLASVFALVLMHVFAARMHFYYIKEIVICLIYAAGIWVVPVGLSGQWSWLVLPFLIAVLQNLFFFSWLDYSDDRKHKFPGLGSVISYNKMKSFVIISAYLGTAAYMAVIYAFYETEISPPDLSMLILSIAFLFLYAFPVASVFLGAGAVAKRYLRFIADAGFALFLFV